MEIIIVDSLEEAGEIEATRLAETIDGNPATVLGLATGSSPLPLYQALRRHVLSGLDMRRVSGFALDEYVGISASDERSYTATIQREVTGPLALDPELVHVPEGGAQDPQQAAVRYEASIKSAGGIDVQILGIGSDGHLGFNEPGSSLASRTRIKTLSQRTREDNARFFATPEEVPRHCITQGLGTIMDARHLLLFAGGRAKAAAIAAALEGPVSSRCPASVIQMHPSATVYVDTAAATELELADFYKYTYANKPSLSR
ncbi:MULTISPECIES: glucosamine-6-phosphate deaminase [Paenarthrobacter]|uniref:Glucosamine-6-phosphate deaminase n=1 Tax=Paenarthrobacter ureafaciens TaxID=37931 RepID=A0AAX3EMF5_PAEUR|nr:MULTISPECIES: glucosamine-6-phosphate deaminase [Paenarthrobacter]NKR13569.1 multidrug transporter [Arthrobacter sp. M5]NKR15444.1 multidrug transporter [Arthrobacter sp. M6]OEH59311.1 multidrug transporter [Arthrobacter sp. D2]OEH60706.1 multidrug transporter [Arthrobacter sp. D4]MDO5864367.1 glucosamine-6-phosphate deaminase [Paenarthrobacter sp. SD-2]